MGRLLDNLLEGTNLKPYMLQRQLMQAFPSDVWEFLREQQYDTLEEARAAQDQEQTAFAGRYRYRVVEVCPYIDYRPVPPPQRGW